nr:MAG TPA: protein of unknown function (DUF3885) [Bacteriophage sp.]
MNLLTFLSVVTDDVYIHLYDEFGCEVIGEYLNRNKISISEASRYSVSFFTVDNENVITVFVKEI